MLFQMVEQNNNFIRDKQANMHDCLICLETIVSEKGDFINLNAQQTYVKKCECGGQFHNRCLHAWCTLSSSCPICRKRMTEVNRIPIINKRYRNENKDLYKISLFSYCCMRCVLFVTKCIIYLVYAYYFTLDIIFRCKNNSIGYIK